MQYRLAVVEDNATARANLRSHLLSVGLFDVFSFSNGNELKSALKKQNFDIVVFDYHLGQRKNGVEWVRHLREAEFIRPSTGVVFITADHAAHTIGHIIDIHPDVLLLKPYTIATLTRAMTQYVNFRREVHNVLSDLDNGNVQRAIREIEKVKLNNPNKRLLSEVNKLHARVLMQAGFYAQARRIYDQVLAASDRVLWAQWGKIKCQYLEGQFSHCKSNLSQLVSGNLSRDKAFEWLASLSFLEQSYTQAEFYLNHINDSELSVPATKLKSMTYKKQNRVLEGIELLQKKREFNRSTRERFDEFTYELAEFYLSIAEQSPVNQREESLSQARKLIGIAGRGTADTLGAQKHDFLMAYAAVLDNDFKRARELVSQENMEQLSRADASTLICAAKVWKSLGEAEKAADYMDFVREKLSDFTAISDQVSNVQHMKESERQMGLADDRALALNDTGTKLFVAKDYNKAMAYFFDAYDLMPNTAAFALNLLNCLVDAKRHSFRTMTVKTLLEHLTSTPLEGNNLDRFNRLRQQIEAAAAYFLPPPQTNEANIIPDASVSAS